MITKIQSPGIIFMLMLCLTTLMTNAQAGKAKEFNVDVYQAGQGNISHYRIPSLVAGDGFLFAFAEGRKHGSADLGEISIVLKRSSDRGKTWGELIQVVKSGGESVQNPTPVWIDAMERLILLFTKRTVGTDTEHMIRNGSAAGYMGVYQTVSDDLGLTWSDPVEITTNVKRKNWNWYAVGPGGAVVMKYNPGTQGRIIVPANHSLHKGSSNEFLGAHVIWSDNNGTSWNIGAADSEGEGTVNPNETAVTELTNGDLYFNTRNHSAIDTIAHRAIALSHDAGLTFTTPFHHEKQLLTPIVHASLARSATAIYFIAPNNWEKRINLSLWISNDETTTWLFNRVLYAGPSAYSSCCMLGDNVLGILFEADEYEKIVFKSLPLEDIGR